MHAQEQHYETMLSMAKSPEWEQFIDVEVNPAITMLKDSLATAETEKEMYRIQGQLGLLKWLVSFRDIVENRVAMQTMEDADATV